MHSQLLVSAIWMMLLPGVRLQRCKRPLALLDCMSTAGEEDVRPKFGAGVILEGVDTKWARGGDVFYWWAS